MNSEALLFSAILVFIQDKERFAGVALGGGRITTFSEKELQPVRWDSRCHTPKVGFRNVKESLDHKLQTTEKLSDARLNQLKLLFSRSQRTPQTHANAP